jgi:hypothetical protein
MSRQALQTATLRRPPRLTRLTRKNQVTIPKLMTDARGLGLGSLFQVEERADGFLLKPVAIIPDPDQQAYLDAKAGKGLSPTFDTVDEFLADLHRATRVKPARVRRRRQRK